MRWVEDDEAAAWLATAPALEWDDANTRKLAKHRLSLAEVAAVFAGVPYLLGRIVEPAHPEQRWVALGQTATGPRVAVIFTRRKARLRPISCRTMRRNERRLYEERRSQEGGPT
jgi:uncharacterized DUF497 family protein